MSDDKPTLKMQHPPQPVPDAPLCATCRHSEMGGRKLKYRYCRMSGERSDADESLCLDVRKVGGACGPDGKLWEAT